MNTQHASTTSLTVDSGAIDELSIESLLPHEHPMILLDRVVSYQPDGVTCRVTPAVGKPFASDKGHVPGWVGIEYMAQAIAAWAGVSAHLAKKNVKAGFLLGSRKYQVSVPVFKGQQALDIKAAIIYEDDGLSSFECIILEAASRTVLATATVNTYQPKDLDAFMETGGQ